jgi:hypothetical protein
VHLALLLCLCLCTYFVVYAMSWFTDIFNPPKPKEALVYCVPQSIACAWSWRNGHHDEVRIAVQHIKPGKDHCQAQALTDEGWKPLVMFWTDKGPVTRIGHAHFAVDPYRYVDLEQWIDEQREFIK